MCIPSESSLVSFHSCLTQFLQNARAGPVFISGATGPAAERINGFFLPTQEKSQNGRVIYGKHCDASVCIEHCIGQWQVKPESKKGSNTSYARVQGDCAFEVCISRGWMVSGGAGNGFLDSPSMSMLIGSEAERAQQRQVSRYAILLTPCNCVPMLPYDELPFSDRMPPWQLLLPTKTRELSPCSSSVSQATRRNLSTVYLHRRWRRGWMGA